MHKRIPVVNNELRKLIAKNNSSKKMKGIMEVVN